MGQYRAPHWQGWQGCTFQFPSRCLLAAAAPLVGGQYTSHTTHTIMSESNNQTHKRANNQVNTQMQIQTHQTHEHTNTRNHTHTHNKLNTYSTTQQQHTQTRRNARTTKQTQIQCVMFETRRHVWVNRASNEQCHNRAPNAPRVHLWKKSLPCPHTRHGFKRSEAPIRTVSALTGCILNSHSKQEKKKRLSH